MFPIRVYVYGIMDLHLAIKSKYTNLARRY